MLEIYGGVGVPSLVLARGGAVATVVEADPSAVACGREAAERSGIRGVEYVRADVLGFLSGAGARPRPDAILADPPRTGRGRGVAEAMAEIGSPTIVLVSCDPATLARDLKTFARLGYSTRRVTPVDLFPQTPHVEAVAWLECDLTQG